ncbi:hypothetical protein [Porticoccus sp.]
MSKGNDRVNTIYGEMDVAGLEKQEGVIDNDNEHTVWVEYHLKGELVHRSVHVTLKQGLDMVGEVEGFG